MKTVRFSNVVEKAGQPETHLVLLAPAKDRALQKAIKTNRVMTVQQTTVGTKTDRGEIGFHPGTSRQFLIFPRSLRAFAGRSVVGIKYDLLGSPEIPKSERAPAPKPPKKAPRKLAADESPRPAEVKRKKSRTAAKSNVVPFQSATVEDDEDDAIAELKKKVRHAMDVLEDGKPVAAFNLLKRIAED